MYIHWDPALELDNEMADAQHRLLWLLLRKLDITIKTKASDQTIRWGIQELKKFTEFHFVSEENLMREIGYPHADDHALLHSEFMMQFDMLVARISHHKEFPEDLLYFYNKWVSQHLLQEDRKVTEFASTAEKRAIAEDQYAHYLRPDAEE